MNVLLSYPRSGNSLTRIILEYITRCTVKDETPTAPNSVINQLESEGKNAYNELNVSKVDDQIILVKTHLSNTESTIQRFKNDKLNLILRHYDDAISSHSTKVSINHQIAEGWINSQVKLYCDIIKFYHNYNPLYYFYYEDLIDIDLQPKIIQDLIVKNEFENISTYWNDYVENIHKINSFGYNTYKNKMEDFARQETGKKDVKKQSFKLKDKVYNQLGKDLFELYLGRYS